MSKNIKRILYFIILISVYFVIVEPYVLPKIGFTLYKKDIVINYFYSNKSDFEYIADNIQNKNLFSIEKDRTKIIFKIDERLENGALVEKTTLYDGDEKLKLSCEQLFGGYISVEYIWIDETNKYNKEDPVGVRIKFKIDSKENTRQIQGIIYTKNRVPSSEVKSEYIKLEENWYYYQEDWDDLNGG